MPVKSRGVGALAAARRVHLVGIAGSGMSALASLLVAQGKLVSGSDISVDAPDQLVGLGIYPALGHRAHQIGDAELLIISAAVPMDSPEVVGARQRGIPVLTHAQALGELMSSRCGIAVAGTHGKSTTTAMLGYVLEQAGLDPTVLVGATALNFGSGARAGQGRHLVVEADEYYRRFLELDPTIALITGIEADHLDYFRNMPDVVSAFHEFADRLAPAGLLVTSADDPLLARAAFSKRRLSYGTAPGADWRLNAFQPRFGGGCAFKLCGPPGQADIELQLTGLHNAMNAAGVAAAAHELGAPLDVIAAALANFRGTERRFETVWKAGGIWVVDDYAHHPTAVRATLSSAREVHTGRIWAVFQPHTSNRVATMLSDFATCFETADELLLLPIYQPAGRELSERWATVEDMAAAIRNPKVTLANSIEATEIRLARDLRSGDLAVIMGAGDVTRVSHGLAGRFERALG